MAIVALLTHFSLAIGSIFAHTTVDTNQFKILNEQYQQPHGDTGGQSE